MKWGSLDVGSSCSVTLSTGSGTASSSSLSEPPPLSRETQDLPARAFSLTLAECFQTFVRAIFYVGKGTRARPDAHLWEALGYRRRPRKQVSGCTDREHFGVPYLSWGACWEWPRIGVTAPPLCRVDGLSTPCPSSCLIFSPLLTSSKPIPLCPEALLFAWAALESSVCIPRICQEVS